MVAFPLLCPGNLPTTSTAFVGPIQQQLPRPHDPCQIAMLELPPPLTTTLLAPIDIPGHGGPRSTGHPPMWATGHLVAV